MDICSKHFETQVSDSSSALTVLFFYFVFTDLNSVVLQILSIIPFGNDLYLTQMSELQNRRGIVYNIRHCNTLTIDSTEAHIIKSHLTVRQLVDRKIREYHRNPILFKRREITTSFWMSDLGVSQETIRLSPLVRWCYFYYFASVCP